MDLAKLLKLLYKHRFTLVLIPVITVVITYFLVRNLPDIFMAQAQIATGIVDDTQNVLNSDDHVAQESQINQEFSNLIEMMKLNRMIDQVGYKLILHDLTSPTPFRELSNMIKGLNPEAKKHAIEVFKNKYQKREGLSLWNNDQRGINELLRSMKYDEGSIKMQLTVYRANNSDFINAEYTSESAELSAFVVNTLCKEFIEYYTSLVKENQRKAVNFLEALLREKYQAMNQKIALLRDYKIKYKVLNLYEQSKSLYIVILDFETKRQQTAKDIIAYNGAVQSMDAKFSPKERKYLESTLTRVNQDILVTKQKLSALQIQYIKSNFKDDYKQSVDSLNKILTQQINQLTDKYVYNPLSAKQDIVQQKLQLEVQLDLARNSLKSYEQEIKTLNVIYDKLVPHEAVVQSYERDIDVASREYLEILNKYNQTHMESNYSVKLRQIQEAMPGLPLPSKKMLLVILSGIVSFVFCMVVLFVLFFLDDSITLSKELANKTGLPVLGQVKLISGSKLDLNNIWKNSNVSKESQELKEQLRSIRFEIDRELGDAKVLGITSLKSGEGKTFLAVSLAYAYSMINKKVLLIDGNFGTPSISQTVKSGNFIEDILRSGTEPQFDNENLINVIGNKGEDYSLLELGKEALIQQKVDEFKSRFDLIIIETSSLDSLSKAKEWFIFTDKILGVIEINQSLRESKRVYINYLKSLNNQAIGWVLNKIPQELLPKKKERNRFNKILKIWKK